MTFRLTLTGDFFDESGQPKFADLGLAVLEPHSHISISRFSEHWPTIGADQIEELFRDIGRTACQSMLDLSLGRRPARGVLNPELFQRESFRHKWRRIVGVELQ